MAKSIETKETDKALSKVIDTSITPLTKKISLTIGHCVGIIQGPLSIIDFFSNKFSQDFIKNFGVKIEIIPDENIIEVVPEIGCEILQKIPMTSSEELRNLYLELLYKASNSETVNLIHPGFIQIISEMTPGEAKIIMPIPLTPQMSPDLR